MAEPMTDERERYESWLSRESTPEPMSDDYQAAIFAWTTKHGPPNCWTGTVGAAAGMMRELLKEVRRLRSAPVPSLREMPAEEAYRLACEVHNAKHLYGPWEETVTRGRVEFMRRNASKRGEDVLVFGPKWYVVGIDVGTTHPTARAAMLAADEALRAAGAILVGGVPDDSGVVAREGGRG